jgi:hypothetical protein
MQKMYSRSSRSERVNQNTVPTDETIKFLLDYSKALRIVAYKKLRFVAVLN